MVWQLCGPRGDQGFNGGSLGVNGGWGFGYPTLNLWNAFKAAGDSVRLQATILTASRVVAAGGAMGKDGNYMYGCPGLVRLKYTTCSKSEPIDQSSTYVLSTGITYTTVNKTDSVNYLILKAKTQGTSTSITWDFGDGESQQGDSVVTHYFPKKGTYSIKLTVVDFLSNTASASKDIAITADDPAYVPHKLIWSDEFDGTTLNTSNWVNETNIDVNNEWQKYTNGDNLAIKDGILTITAKKVGSGQKKGDYTSGRINSNGLKTFLYGRMEIRAKLPAGRGTWEKPAKTLTSG